MEEENALVDTTMTLFGKMRLKKDSAADAALAKYLEYIPDALLQGKAHQMARQYLRQRSEKTPLNNVDMLVVAVQICQQILNELIQKTRTRTESVIAGDLDGAELFYRRALTHIAVDRYADAERLLRRAVEICPDFIDGWDVLVEVLEYNQKPELAEQARLRLRELKMKI
jgi:tetratricopeptide (TPR) repeat protein